MFPITVRIKFESKRESEKKLDGLLKEFEGFRPWKASKAPEFVRSFAMKDLGELMYGLQPLLARGSVNPTTIMIDSSMPKSVKSSMQ